MELRTLLFLLCLSASIIGSLSKQTKHGFKSILHDNMKEYFKNYMVGNFKGVHEKQFDTLKISKWIGDDVSKRAQLAAEDFLINADPNLGQEEEADTLQELPANLQAAAVGKRDIPSKVARDSFQNANLNRVPERDISGALNLAEEADTLQELPANLQAAAVGKRDIPSKVARDSFQNANLNRVPERGISGALNLAEEAETLQELPANLQAAAVGKRDIPSKVARDSFQNANLNRVPERDISGALNLAEEAETLQELPANLQAAAVGKRDIPSKVARDSFQNANLNRVPERDISGALNLAEEADTLQELPANLQAAAVGKRDIPSKVARDSFQNANLNRVPERGISGALNLAEEAETLQELPANLQAAAVGKRDIPSKVARDSFQNANLNRVPERDISGALNLGEEADTLQELPANLQAAAVGKRDNPNEESPDILAWLNEASDRRQKLSIDIDSFFKSWDDVLNISSSGCGETPKVQMSTHNADLSLLGMTPVFMDLFWPFRFDVNVMNQRLAVYDLTKKIITDNETLKEFFFEELQDLQGMRLPVRGNQITFSFGDEDVVDGLNRSRLVPHSKSYMKAGKHLFTNDEQEKILVLANKALDVINKTHSELYSAMVQMISSIAFFKDDSDLYKSGSITSALGLVWLDPRQEWTVPLMAEQIVHEFIHTSLYYAELVHGTYRDVSRLPEAQVMSAIRHVPRNYDKSLHAAYVSAGLITFHTRVGLFERAAQLAKTLPVAVQELNRVNAETDVLDESGRAMLDFLTDYICLTRV